MRARHGPESEQHQQAEFLEAERHAPSGEARSSIGTGSRPWKICSPSEKNLMKASTLICDAT